MKSLFLTTTLSVALAGAAFAAGTHDGGHGGGHGGAATDSHGAEHAAMMMIGEPGTADHVDREIAVTMRETDDGMVFEPASFEIRTGETIRFAIENVGELEHEFVIDTMERNVEHKALMAKFDMEHDDPNSVRLDTGASGEVIWTFSNAGIFEFACLIPGHYESGMHGPITVN